MTITCTVRQYIKVAQASSTVLRLLHLYIYNDMKSRIQIVQCCCNVLVNSLGGDKVLNNKSNMKLHTILLTGHQLYLKLGLILISKQQLLDHEHWKLLSIYLCMFAHTQRHTHIYPPQHINTIGLCTVEPGVGVVLGPWNSSVPQLDQE